MPRRCLVSKPKLIITAVLTILVLILIFQNWTAFPVSFLFWSGSLPGTLMLLIAVAIGFVIGLVAAMTWLKSKDA